MSRHDSRHDPMLTKEQIRSIVKEEVGVVLEPILEELRKQILDLQSQVRKAKDNSSAATKKANETAEKLASSEKQNNMQLVAIKTETELAVTAALDEKIVPRLNAMYKHFEEKTLDGTEMVTQWRHRVHDNHNSHSGKGKTKLITGSSSESHPEQKKKDFQESMFAFTDYD
jgi:hypothetical protein